MKQPSISENVRRLVKTVLATQAATSPPALRQAVAARAAALSLNRPDPPPVPQNLEAYVGKVALHAYKVLDREVDALRADGYSVAEVFEITVSAAVGAALARMEVALQALEDAGS